MLALTYASDVKEFNVVTTDFEDCLYDKRETKEGNKSKMNYKTLCLLLPGDEFDEIESNFGSKQSSSLHNVNSEVSISQVFGSVKKILLPLHISFKRLLFIYIYYI